MTERSPAPVEESRPLENEVRAAVTPAIAHVAFIGVESSLANPNTRIITDEQKETWMTQTPDSLKAGIDAANEISLESRQAYDKDDPKSFDEKNAEWNKSFWEAVNDSINEPDTDNHVLGERRMAYESLGLDLTKQEEQNGLHPDVEAFRKKYVAEDASDIQQFITDISSGCKKADGTVDIDKLQERLDAIQPMLSIFGTAKNAGGLVKDFTMAQAILSQDEETKKDIANRMQDQMQRQPSRSEHLRLFALSQKLKANLPPEPITQPDETAEPEEVKQEGEEAPQEPEAPAVPEAPEKQEQPLPAVHFNEKYQDTEGAVYEVVSKGTEMPLALRKDDGQLVLGFDAEDVLRTSKPVKEAPADSPEPPITEGEKIDPAEAIREIGKGIAEAMKPIGDKIAEQEARTDVVQEQIGRRLGSNEMNLITHGTTPEETKAIIDYKINIESLMAYQQAEQAGESKLPLRGVYDIKRTFANIFPGITEERLQQALKPLEASFAKAAELKTQPVYVLTLKKMDNGGIMPRLEVGTRTLPKNPDGSELSEEARLALYKEIAEAGRETSKKDSEQA